MRKISSTLVAVAIVFSISADRAAASSFIANVNAHARVLGEVPGPENNGSQTSIVQAAIATSAFQVGEGGSIGSSWASAGPGAVLRAYATASRGPESDWMFADATADHRDRVTFYRDGVPLSSEDGGFILVSWSANGSSQISGDSGAGGTFNVQVFNFELSEVYLHQSHDIYNGQTLSTGIQAALLDSSILVNGAFDLAYSAYASAQTSGAYQDATSGTANLGNSLYVSLQYVNEFGVIDPTVALVSDSGIDYTLAVPEPSTAVLLLLGCLGMAAWRGQRIRRSVS